jgi:hypothetical protein
MLRPSLLLLVAATSIIVKTYAASSVQTRSHVPELMSYTGKSATIDKQCKEQFVISAQLH